MQGSSPFHNFRSARKVAAGARRLEREADNNDPPDAIFILPAHLPGVPAKKTASVPALERGLAILEVLATHHQGLTLSQLVRHLRLPKSSIHSLLLTFERLGYLTRVEVGGRYVCGLKFMQIAALAFDNPWLRQTATPILAEVMQATGLTVHLGVLWRNEIVLIDRESPVAARSVAPWIGKRLDAHCTSAGKCLIAHLPEHELHALIRERGMLRHNDNTITKLGRLEEVLARVRRVGYAVDNEEEEVGIRCIGVPIAGPEGNIVAAISVSGSTDQISESNFPALVALLQRAAINISRQLAYPRMQVLNPMGAS